MEARIGLCEIAFEMRKGVNIRNHQHLRVLHKNCFVGKDAVDWILKERHAVTRKDAVRLGQRMVHHGLFHLVSSALSVRKGFQDAHLFYRFYCDEGPSSALGIHWAGRSDREDVAPCAVAEEASSEPIWEVVPHTAHNSLVLNLQLAMSLPGEMRRTAIHQLRNRVRRVMKGHDDLWRLDDQTEGPCSAPVYHFSRKRQRGTYQTRKLVGTIPASPAKFQEEMLGKETRKRWEPLLHDYRVVEGGLMQQRDVEDVLPSTPIQASISAAKFGNAPQIQTPSFSEFSFNVEDEIQEMEHYQMEELAQMARANLSDPVLQKAVIHLKQEMLKSCPPECMRCEVRFASASEARCCECCAVVACVACCQKKVYEISQKRVVCVCRHCYGQSSRICHPGLELLDKSTASLRSRASLTCLKGIPQVKSLVSLCEMGDGGECTRMLYRGEKMLRAFQFEKDELEASSVSTGEWGMGRLGSEDSTLTNGSSESNLLSDGLHPSVCSSFETPTDNKQSKYCKAEVGKMRKATCQQSTGTSKENEPSMKAHTSAPRIIYRTISPAASHLWPREVCVFQDAFEDDQGSTFFYEISVRHQNERGQAQHVTAEVLLLSYMATPAKNSNQSNVEFQSAAAADPSEPSGMSVLTIISQVDFRPSGPDWAMNQSHHEGLGIFNFLCNQAEPETWPKTLLPRPRTDTFCKGKVSLESFELLAVLGRGGFGKVLQVRHKDSQGIYAMKVIKKSDLRRKKQVERMNTERTILAALDHPFIVKLEYAFQTRHKLYMVMDFVQGGDLFYLLRQQGQPTLASMGRSGLGEEWTRLYLAEIALALQHLHDQDIVYRDLKPENVLIEKDGHIKLTDFGLSRYLERSFRRPTDLSNDDIVPCAERSDSVCGTEQYMAPEMLLQQGHGPAVDWWCLGVLAHEMASRKHPFKAPSHYETLQAIATKAPSVDPRLSSPFLDLLSKLLVKDQTKRLCCSQLHGISELKNHAFFGKLEWNAVMSKQIEPPYKPRLKGPLDVSYFETVFTKESVYSQASADGLSLSSPLRFNFGLGGKRQKPHVESFDVLPEEIVLFKGFSYVAPENKGAAKRNNSSVTQENEQKNDQEK